MNDDLYCHPIQYLGMCTSNQYIIDMSFKEKEAEVEREVFLKKQARQTWSEDKRKCEQRQRLRETGRNTTRTIGSTSNWYETKEKKTMLRKQGESMNKKKMHVDLK